MSLFERFKTTLRADANGFVDALEDPALMLKQHLRDAELAVQRKQAALSQLEAEAKRLRTDGERASADRARLERDAELAIGQGREDLARYALKLLLPKSRFLERVEARLVAIAEESRALEEKLEAQRAALEELRARAQAYLAERDAFTIDASVDAVTDEQVEIELLRRKSARASAAREEGRDEAP